MRQMMVAITVIGALTLTAAADEEGTRLLRFPDIHGETVVFCYGGDLWSASVDGGIATRLTAHPGQEVSRDLPP